MTISSTGDSSNSKINKHYGTLGSYYFNFMDDNGFAVFQAYLNGSNLYLYKTIDNDWVVINLLAYNSSIFRNTYHVNFIICSYRV